MDVLASASSPATPTLATPKLLQPQNAKNQRALEVAAKDFEGMFVSLLLKEMRQTLEPGTMFGQDSGDVLGGLFDVFIGQHLAKAGALGIGNIVKHQLAAKFR